MAKIIGRKKQIKELERLYNSPKAEFVAIYGRRRVGKTYLIRELFKDRMAFYATGLSPYGENDQRNGLQEQLQSFYLEMQKYGLKGRLCPTSWLEAFSMLENFIDNIQTDKKIVIFIDELPWFDTPKSGFLKAFEHFWNSWGSAHDNLMLIVCGSATSWIEDNLIMNRGGLYNRLTYQMKLQPFTLSECAEFYEYMGNTINQFDILEGYMIFGGIPYYMGYMLPGQSLAQNIDTMFFADNGRLKNEFSLLFGSLFTNPDNYIKIVKYLSGQHCGYTRDEIIKATGIQSGSTLSKILDSLEASCFIRKYQPFGNNKRECKYKLVDNFCMFYLKFVSDNKNDRDFWIHNINKPILNTWRGIAFEEVCFQHIDKIKDALGIGKVVSLESSWNVRGNDDHEGSQIDLLIDRDDNFVSLCEMKYYSRDFEVDKNYYLKMKNRISILQDNIPKRRNIQTVLITTYGIKQNAYSSVFQEVLTIEDLF